MTKLSTIKCAFCKGKGKDPFGIMSDEARCQVCGGRGEVTVLQPYVPCAHCQATGVSPGSRNVCTVCNGRGTVTLADGKKVCPDCGGTGNERENNLPCLACGGKGVV